MSCFRSILQTVMDYFCSGSQTFKRFLNIEFLSLVYFVSSTSEWTSFYMSRKQTFLCNYRKGIQSFNEVRKKQIHIYRKATHAAQRKRAKANQAER